MLKNEISLYKEQSFRGWVEKAIKKEKLKEEVEQEGKYKAPVWIMNKKEFSKGASISQQRPEIEESKDNRGSWT